MKEAKQIRPATGNVDNIEGHDKDRRSLIRTAVAGMAAFATSFVFSRRAHAACNHCDQYCFPTESTCWVPQGLCYDDILGQYLHMYNVYFGSPVGSCCASVDTLACYDFCYTEALPC